MSRFVIQAMSKAPSPTPGGAKKENGASSPGDSQPKPTPKPTSALTSALSQQKSNMGAEVGSGRLETILSEPSSSPSSESAISSLQEAQLCPPDAFPCLYYHELSEDVDVSVFEEDSAAVSLRVGTPINEWSLGRSAGSSLSRSLGGSFLGRDDTGTPVADYEENPFSRRAAEFVPSPNLNNARWNALGSPSIEANYLTEAVVGSLPKAMTPSERTRMSSRLGASPSLKDVKDLPEERISARTVEGRALRRRLLKGKVMVFITAGYSGKRFIYERIKELGVRSVMIDGPESWSRILEEEGVLEKFVPFDWSDNDTVFDRCLEACKRVEQELGQLDGVVSFWEIAQPLVARLAETLGLPGNLPDSVDAAREKQRTRQGMAEAGLPTPKNLLISSFQDLPKAAQHVGFPAVIKPISGAASLGVVRVDSFEALEKTYKRAMAEMGAIRLDKDGNFVSADSDLAVKEQTGAAGTAYVANLFLMEQYLDGPEVDVDVVLSKGEPVYGSITDNWPTIEPYFNETGSNCPSILPLEQQKALCQLAVQAVKALGFTMGAFHVEGKYTSHGPHIIEVNARMGGGPVRDINKIVYGVDLIEEHLLAAAGIPAKPLVAARPLKHIAEYSVNAKQTGVLLTKDYLQDWVDHPDVLYIRALVDEGQRVVCAEDGMPTWMYEMMVTKPTVEEAIAFIKGIEEAVHIPIAKVAPLK